MSASRVARGAWRVARGVGRGAWGVGRVAWVALTSLLISPRPASRNPQPPSAMRRC